MCVCVGVCLCGVTNSTGVQADAEPTVAAARRAALDSLPVDDAAVSFGRDLTAALDEAEAHAVTFTPLKLEPFTADRYVKVRLFVLSSLLSQVSSCAAAADPTWGCLVL